jgi:uncharacterized membrane protein
LHQTKLGGFIVVYVLVLLIGVVAGLRAATPIAAISLGAYLGWLDFSGTWYSFLGSLPAVIILALLAILELVGDQLPTTPSRKVPMQFGGRVVMGAIAGALLLPGNWIIGLIIGAIGAVIGTLGGAEVRSMLAKAFGRDLSAGILEDIVAVVVALLIVSSIA